MTQKMKGSMKKHISNIVLLTGLASSLTSHAGAPPVSTGTVTPMSLWSAGVTKNQAGIIMGDPESNALLTTAYNRGFGDRRPFNGIFDGNFVKDWPQRDRIIQSGNSTDALFGINVDLTVTYVGRKASRKVVLVDHAIRGAVGGDTAMFSIGEDKPSFRWVKQLVIQHNDGTKEELRYWRGVVVSASQKKFQCHNFQTLITAASATKSTFLEKTLLPVSQAPSAFTADRVLFTSGNGTVNSIRRAGGLYDASMRDCAFFAQIVAQHPDVGFLRMAARDDFRASTADVSNETDGWAKKSKSWGDKIKKWVDELSKALGVIIWIVTLFL